jgi:hypothetical protein
MFWAKACGSAEERASACAVIWSVPGARPRPRSMRSPCMFASVPYCSATMSGAWLGSMTPPAPTRIRSVAAAACEMSRAVALEARLTVLWCSANHRRL